jgi:hypothetical protein
VVASGACRATYRADRARRKPPLIRVIVKLPTRDATGRESGATQALYAPEVRFYTELAGVVGITTPRCLHADIDADSGTFALVLDGLTPAHHLAGTERFMADSLAAMASAAADYERLGLSSARLSHGKTAPEPTARPARTSGGTSARTSPTGPSWS